MIDNNVRIPKMFLERIEKMINDAENFKNAKLFQAFRVNTWKSNNEETLNGLNIGAIRPVPWYENGFFVDEYARLGNTLEYFLGHIYVQDASSMFPPTLLDGKVILDMCAAPGSKTTQLSQDNKDSLIIANEINVHRMKALNDNISRLGCLNVVVSNYDAKNFPAIDLDSILLDAPCSSDGMMFRDDTFFKRWSMKRVHAFSKLQKSLIMKVYEILRPGGTLVYSTCTSSPEENELVVSHLLENSDAELEKIAGPFRKGIDHWNGKRIDEMEKCVRIWPQDFGSETFFVAKIRKP